RLFREDQECSGGLATRDLHDDRAIVSAIERHHPRVLGTERGGHHLRAGGAAVPTPHLPGRLHRHLPGRAAVLRGAAPSPAEGCTGRTTAVPRHSCRRKIAPGSRTPGTPPRTGP